MGHADLVDRIDLRDRHFTTIDPETARDFDDAVAIDAVPHRGHARCGSRSPTSRTTSARVTAGREALAAACTVYLPDCAIPMLPRAALGEICSLVAIDVTTGRPRWSFQTVKKDVWDYDLGSQPSLIDYKGIAAVVVPVQAGRSGTCSIARAGSR